MTSTIRIENLTKTFKGHDGGLTTAVDRVSLEIASGELFFLLGPSGCGKTTLLRMLAGFIDPTAGSIFFNDRDVTHTPANKRNTGMVFQSYALWPHMTVADNVAFGLKIRSLSKTQQNKQIGDALEAVQMLRYADRKPTQLSGGQQQRVALARALVIKPDVLLLDEPLSNLDAKLRGELRNEIRRTCKASGITTVYVTHDQKEAMSIADRLAILRDGRIEQIASPTDAYYQPQNRFVSEFLGETNIIAGRLGRDTTGVFRVETPFGKLRINQTARPDQSEMLCSIRPESWKVAGADAGGAIVGSVESTTFLGESTHLEVKVGGRTLLAMVHGRQGVRSIPDVGEPIGLTADPDEIAVIEH
jgi:iron(III) transport system ATP-binding protein